MGRKRIGALGALFLAAGISIALAAAVGAASTESAKLTASDAAAGDEFSVEVAISGDTIVVGSWHDDDNGTDSGSAYVFVRNGTTWSQQAKLTASDGVAGDQFAHTVDIEGDTIVVGAWNADGAAVDSGKAYIFVRNGTNWNEQATLTASDAAAGDQLGVKARISGESVVVGAYKNDDSGTDSGSAYVFVRSGTTWDEQAKLTASDAAAGDQLGNVVAIAGDTVGTGAWLDRHNGVQTGSAYIFVRTGTTWDQQAKITSPDGDDDDRFGGRVEISGETALIGAWRHDAGGLNSGAAYVFVRDGTTWTQQAKLQAADTMERDAFGIGARIDGDKIVIGAWREDSGGIDAGAAYVFVRNGTTWDEQAKLVASDPAPGDRFGVNAAISGDTVVIGSWDDDDAGTSSGSAYVFDVAGTPSQNTAPVVIAPADQTITLPATATLNGSATDDGLPAPPSLTTLWSKVSGPGTLTFADPLSASTTATFSDPGLYVLQLEATDGALTTSATVEITVNAPAEGLVYVSSTTSGVVDGISFGDEDILVYDHGADTWAMFFDGSDVGLTTADIDGFNIVDDTPSATVIEMTFTGPRSISGVIVDDSDVATFTGTSGVNTSGTIALTIDASDVGLSSGGEDIDALSTDGSGYVFSTLGAFNVPGPPSLIGQDEDLIGFVPGSTGPTTTGTFSQLFDGSTVDFAQEDVVSAWIDTATGDVYGSSLNSFNVPGLRGDGDDIFMYAGGFTKYFDGDAHRFGGEQIDGLHIDLEPGAPGGTPPVAVDDGPDANSIVGDPFHTDVDTTLIAASGSAEDVLANDTLGDPAAVLASFGAGDLGGAITDNLADTTANFGTGGNLTINADGSFGYTPSVGFTGEFSFEYRISNGAESSDATVAIFVGDRPPPPEGDKIYLSSSTSGVVDGIPFGDEDILVYDRGADTWAMFFDGSNAGLTSADIDGFNIVDDTPGAAIIEMTFTGPRTVSGIGLVDDSDVVTFTEASGTFALLIDGSDVGLSSGGEDIDALTTDSSGYVFSTLGSFNVPGSPNVVGGDEDLVGLAPTTTGATTSGAFSLLFDGSGVDFAQEDIVSAWVDTATGDVYGSSLNNFNVPGLSGDGDDIFVYSGGFTKYFDGDAHRFGGEQIDGLHIELGAPA